MKIPKNVNNIIIQRRLLAERLNKVDCELSDWMESKGMELSEMTDFVRSGCMMYCEPSEAEDCVRTAIESFQL